jgi:hypothetical protein
MSIKEQSQIIQRWSEEMQRTCCMSSIAIMLKIKNLDWDSCLAIAQFAIAEATGSHEDEEGKACISDALSILAHNLDEIIEENRCWKDVQPHRKEQS